MAVPVGGHWQITKVGWNLDIAVLEFQYGDFHTGPATFTLKDLPFPTGSFDLFGETIKVGDGEHDASIVNPISKEMIKSVYLWNRPPHKVGPNSDEIYSAAAILFFDINRIRRELPREAETLTFTVATPAGATFTKTETIYWIWSDIFYHSFEEALEHPHTTGDPLTGHIISLPMGFATAAEADRYASLSVLPPFLRHDTTETRTLANALAWNARLSTYRNKKDFPVTNARPGWNVEPDPYHSGSVADPLLKDFAKYSVPASSVDHPLPAMSLRFTINKKTLHCAIERL